MMIIIITTIDDDTGMEYEKDENIDDEIEENDGDDDDDDEEKCDDDDDDDDDDGILMMVDVCIDGIMIMVMGNMMIWQNSWALSGIGCVCPDGVSPDDWRCLSSWYFDGLLIIFRWSLASWWHFGGCP